MMKKTILIFAFLLISSCGYETIHSKKNSSSYNFSINSIDFTGDRDVNLKIKQKLNSYVLNKKDNEILYLLLLEVEKKTGYPILLNTSFNLPGEPIVESPQDALSSFSRGALDNLFLGNVLISR